MTTSRLTTPQRVKLGLRGALLRTAGVRRIHIVGCARSGTTMLHYSMLAFENTLLIDHEVSAVGSPSVRESGRLLLEHLLGRHPVHLVTKRDFAWFRPDRVALLSDLVPRESMGIINIVRDPRDVLTSRITSVTTRRYYVEPQRWVASVRAGEELLSRLEGYPRKLTVRYEDLVMDPKKAQDAIASTFDLTLRPGIESMGRLKDNLDKLDATTRLSRFLGEIRNFDPSTAGRWRDDPEKEAYVTGLMAHSEVGSELKAFMDRHGYSI